MQLAMILDSKKISAYRCSQISGIPYTTLSELIRGKTSIEKCSAETLYKLSTALDMPMGELFEQVRNQERRTSFETFKSNECHKVKDLGDMDYIISILQNDEVGRYWRMKWYPEAYYTLAMLDYLCRENALPLCTKYNDLRNGRLKQPIFPRDIELAAKLDSGLDWRTKAMDEAIPEFMRFNIVEKEIRNVC